MAKVEEIALRSWDEFKRDVARVLFPDDGVFVRGRYLFRGVGNTDWELSSAFDRHFPDLDSRNRVLLFHQMLEEFRVACRAQGFATDASDDDIVLQALGQHYGLPTRLLDWTESPYIAAYFAFHHWSIESQEASCVAVWSLNVASGIWSQELGVEVVGAEAVSNERLRRQAGRFTYSRTPFRTLEEYVEGCRTDEQIGLWKFVLPREEARCALSDLDAMGINGLTLFPDHTGAAATAYMRVALRHALTLEL